MEPRFENLERVLNEFGREFVNAVADEIILAEGIASGEMLNSLDFEVVKENGSYVVYLDHTDYFRYYNDGTSPHWPPSEPIKEWITNKGLPTADSTGWKGLPTVSQLAFLISRKIAEDGTEARDVFEKAYNKVVPKYEPLWNEALVQDSIDNYLNGYDFRDWEILKY